MVVALMVVVRMVMIVVVTVVVLGQLQQLGIDRIAVRVDDVAVVDEPLERLALGQSRSVPPTVGRRSASCSRASSSETSAPSIRRSISASSSSSDTSRSCGHGDGAKGQIDPHGLIGRVLQLTHERLGVTTGDLQVVLEPDAAALELHEEVLEPHLGLGADHRLGQLVVDQLGQLDADPCPHR